MNTAKALTRGTVSAKQRRADKTADRAYIVERLTVLIKSADNSAYTTRGELFLAIVDRPINTQYIIDTVQEVLWSRAPRRDSILEQKQAFKWVLAAVLKS